MKRQNSTELLQQVRRQMGDGKFSRAFATLKDLLASDPSHQEGRRLLATLLLKFGNLSTAKNAFETLVKEALQRRDPAEAESLLQEYLAAGPRCVTFIEMLGTAYELKGDPLAAVFEYEKAIDIFLEDPDPVRPTHAQDLFEKIKQLAPSSFVANRVAARLQPPVTAQTPSPALPEAPLERDDGEESMAIGSTSSEAVEEQPRPLDRNTHDSEVEEAETDAEPEAEDEAESDGMESSSETHEEPLVQNAAPQPISSTRANRDDKVPFPPVNRISEQDGSVKQEDQDNEELDDEVEAQPESDRFSSAPVCEPSDVGFYPQESEISSTESKPLPASVITDSGGAQTVASGETPNDDANEARQDTYWKRVIGGGRSATSTQAGGFLTPSDGGESGVKELCRPKQQTHYGHDIAAWLSFRLSIFTRRLIATTNSFTKLTIFASAALMAWIILIIGGTAGIWLLIEQKPSETFHRLRSVTPAKTLEDWKNNGYILLLGFGATPSMDPMQEGYDRWLSVTTHSAQGCLDRTAKDRSVARVASGTQKPADWFKTPDPSARFVSEGAQVKEEIDPQGLLVSRYRRLLNLPFEDWGFNFQGSPDCGQILAVHRLYLAEGFAQSFTAGLDRLETDLTAWRKVLAQAKTLSIKAMAVEGINDDLAVMSGLLNRPNADNKVVLQRMMRMARPLDPEERSLRWPMQNEFALALKAMDTRIRPHPDADASLAVVVSKMPLPKQRTLNAYAAYYDALIQASGTSNGRTPKLYDFANTPARTWLDYAYNPIDNLIVADQMPDWEYVSETIIETDARMRLAGLQARFRAPSPESSLVARIAQAGPNFYDPFTGLPMLVNAARGTLYSTGRDHKDDGGDPTFDVSVPFVQ